MKGGKPCPLCRARCAAVGWCGACRQSYRARGMARANVMEVAQWGAERARDGQRQLERFAQNVSRILGGMH